jgi:CRP/FNR family transcriptional regulator, dissimilatory nitrate respiration regulator
MSLEVLQHVAIFASLEPHILEQLLESSQQKTLARHTRLFSSNQEAQDVFVLLSGSARRYCLTTQARELTLERYNAPSVLGLEALFAPQQSEAAMLEDGAVLVLHSDTLRYCAKTNLGFCHALLEWTLHQHNAFVLRMSQMVSADLGARLARLLLAQPEGWQLPPNSLLAAELGTVPELVSRKLGEFYRAGFIRLEKRRVFVVRHSALQGLLETR